MSVSNRLIAALASAAMLLLDGCTSTTCDPACDAGQTCDSTTNSCVTTGGPCQSSSDCEGTATPVCETSTGECVGCLVDTDCATGSCNTSTRACAGPQCLSSADCSADAGTPFCSSEGKCVQCRADSDCPSPDGARYTCDMGTSTCVASPCQTNADCALAGADAGVCDTTTGGCVQCQVDSACSGSTPHCLTATSTCAQCASDLDCDETLDQICTTDTHVCQSPKCVTDESCEGAQRCDLTSGDCVECLADADCYFGGTCMNEACVQPSSCASAADCLLGSFCVTNLCEACSEDTDCASGQTCTAGTCQAPATCTGATDCLARQTCTSGACVSAMCTGAPQDTPATATPITAGSGISLQGTLCPNDNDEYVVAFPDGAGGTFTVKTTASLPTLTLDLYVGPAAASMHVSGTSTQAGVVTAQIPSAPMGADALLIVIGGSQGQSVPYELDSDVEPNGACMSIGSPDSTITEAPTVTPGSYPGMLCPAAESWLAVDVPQNNRLTVSLTSTVPLDGIAVEIRTMVNGEPALDSYSETDSTGAATVTSTSVAGNGGQTYWIQIYNLDQQAFSYTAAVALIPEAPANNHCADATPLATGTATTGYLEGAVNTFADPCGGTGGDTYWTLDLSEASQVEIILSADFPAVMSVMDTCAGADEIGCTMAATGSQTLSFQALSVGKHIIRVAGASTGDAGTYTITAQASAAQPPTVATCSAPIALSFTGTDSNGNPQAMVTGNVAGAADNVTSACGEAGGDAVYSFTLNADQMIVASLDGFSGASASLVPAASCTTPSTGMCVAATSTGMTMLTQSAVPAGSWMLLVDGGTQVAGQYTLTVTQLAPVYPPPNNTCTSPQAIPDGMYSGTTVGANDVFNPPTPTCGTGAQSGSVVYEMSVSGAAEQITLLLDATFNAAMTVTAAPCGTGTVVTCSTGDQQQLVLPNVAPGDYFVWIDGDDGDSGTFTLQKTSGPVQPVPTNQTCATADAVTFASGSAMEMGSTLQSTNTLDPTDCVEAGATTPLTLAGPDLVYSVVIPAGQTLSAVLDPIDFDGALFVVDSCSDQTCAAVSDKEHYAGGEESVTVPNSGTSPMTVYVVVSSWAQAASGNFTLQLQLQQ